MSKVQIIAALIFRIIGALLFMDGVFILVFCFAELIARLLGNHNTNPIPNSECFACLIFGGGIFYFSKKLAVLFSKGLDEKAP